MQENLDMARLIQLALHAENRFERAWAVERLNDQKTLIYIAQHDKEAGIRRYAVNRINDIKTLDRIFWHDDDRGVKKVAYERIYDLGGKIIGHFISFLIDYMRSERVYESDLSIRTGIPKKEIYEYLCGGKPNLSDFRDLARAIGYDYDSFVKKYGP